MKKDTKLRLATPGQVGANAYNAYHIISQISSLYVSATGFDHRTKQQEIWLWLAESTLSDVEAMYKVWETVRNEGDYAIPIMENQDLSKQIIRLNLRLESLQKLLNEWVPMRRWPRLMLMLEAKWRTLIWRFVELDDSIQPAVRGILDVCDVRVAKLNRLAEYYDREAKKYAENFTDVQGL